MPTRIERGRLLRNLVAVGEAALVLAGDVFPTAGHAESLGESK